jgi:glycosyltransferase involved in cell wall biosynthesis
VPVITTIHTQYEMYSHWVPFHQPTVKRILREKTRAYCECIDLVLTPGQARKEELRAMGVTTPIEVVPNATDLEPFERASGEELRAQLGLEREQPLVLYVGRATPEKNLDVLVRAMATVVQQEPEARLLIAGGGPEIDPLQQLAAELGVAEQVTLAGRVPYEDVPEYHAAADVLATASLSEVQPVSLTEAMAAGAPVVAVDADWARDVVKPGENGLLAGNMPGDLAAEILRVLTDRELRARLSEGARREARKYAILPATERLVETYESVLSGA